MNVIRFRGEVILGVKLIRSELEDVVGDLEVETCAGEAAVKGET